MAMLRYKKLSSKVYSILKQNLAARKYDSVLYYFFLKRTGVDPENTKVVDLLSKVYHNEIPSFESVARCRRRLQQLKPEVRGDNYEKRQEEQEAVKDELGYR